MPLRIRERAHSLMRIAAGILAASVTASGANAFDAKRWDASVLRIFTLDKQPDGKNGPNTGVGTGFVIDREYVLTNHHVIDDEDIKKAKNRAVYLVIDGSMQNEREAQLVWSSRELDLAVLRVPGLTRPALTLSSAPMMEYPRKAETVWIIGFPGVVRDALRSEEGMHVLSTVTKGVAAKIVMGGMQGADDKTRPVIQHSAGAGPGNSGGPLFDDCGVVIGVHTFSPRAYLRVVEARGGGHIAHGATNPGVFFAPHIGNFVEAQKTAPQLKALKISTSSAVCPSGFGDAGGMPVWLYGAIGVFALMAMTGMVVAFTRRREVVRMVESYSAYVKRKGRSPSEESMQPRPVTSPPDISASSGARGPSAAAAASAATGSWKFSGKGSKGQEIAIAVTAEAVYAATANKEGGLIIGRAASLVDKVVDDPSVSRRHAKIYATEQGLAVEDLKSAYGTKVNGHQLEPFQAVEIKAGDKLTLGAVELTVAKKS